MQIGPKKSIYRKQRLTQTHLTRSQGGDNHGLLPKAPGLYPLKYIFSTNSNDVSTSFCSCIPNLYELKSEVFISPS